MVTVIQGLPAELLDAVVGNLNTRTAIHSLMQTCYRLFEVTIHHLDSFNAEHESCSALPRAAKHGRHATIAKYPGDQRTIIPPPAAIRDALEAATVFGCTETVKLLLHSRSNGSVQDRLRRKGR